MEPGLHQVVAEGHAERCDHDLVSCLVFPSELFTARAIHSGCLMRILFLDDYTAGHATMLKVLRALGLTVSAAATRAEAIAIIDEGGIDGYIIDLHLGDDDPRGGIRVLEYLRRAGSRAPVIVLTGKMSPEAKAEAESLGAHYMLKPAPSIRALADYLWEHQPHEARTRSGLRERHLDGGDVPDGSGTFVQPTLEHVAAALAAIEGPTPEKVERLKDLAYAGALRDHGGNVTQAAHALGITRQALQRWLSRARTG
jgi:DNA-binding NtrC family response regulator